MPYGLNQKQKQKLIDNFCNAIIKQKPDSAIGRDPDRIELLFDNFALAKKNLVDNLNKQGQLLKKELSAKKRKKLVEEYRKFGEECGKFAEDLEKNWPQWLLKKLVAKHGFAHSGKGIWIITSSASDNNSNLCFYEFCRKFQQAASQATIVPFEIIITDSSEKAGSAATKPAVIKVNPFDIEISSEHTQRLAQFRKIGYVNLDDLLKARETSDYSVVAPLKLMNQVYVVINAVDTIYLSTFKKNKDLSLQETIWIQKCLLTEDDIDLFLIPSYKEIPNPGDSISRTRIQDKLLPTSRHFIHVAGSKKIPGQSLLKEKKVDIITVDDPRTYSQQIYDHLGTLQPEEQIQTSSKKLVGDGTARSTDQQPAPQPSRFLRWITKAKNFIKTNPVKIIMLTASLIFGAVGVALTFTGVFLPIGVFLTAIGVKSTLSTGVLAGANIGAGVFGGTLIGAPLAIIRSIARNGIGTAITANRFNSTLIIAGTLLSVGIAVFALPAVTTALAITLTTTAAIMASIAAGLLLAAAIGVFVKIVEKVVIKPSRQNVEEKPPVLVPVSPPAPVSASISASPATVHFSSVGACSQGSPEQKPTSDNEHSTPKI